MKISSFFGLAGFLMLASSLAGCTPSQPIATILIHDMSLSAIEDKEFAAIAKQSCHALARSLRPTDVAGSVAVSGSPPNASDLKPVLDPRLYHRACQPSKKAQLVGANAPQGTFSCPAWALSEQLSHRQDFASYPVVYVSVIQTNDLESPCPAIWKGLAEDSHKRGGKLAIVGSSVGNAENPALDHTFNRLLWTELKEFPSVVFCEEDVRGCVERAFDEVRRNQKNQTQGEK